MSSDYFWQESEAYDSNNGPALMREMVSDTGPVQPTPGVTFSTRSQSEVRQTVLIKVIFNLHSMSISALCPGIVVVLSSLV